MIRAQSTAAQQGQQGRSESPSPAAVWDRARVNLRDTVREGRVGLHGRVYQSDLDTDGFRALSGKAVQVYAAIACFAGRDSVAWPSQATIARIAATSQPHVSQVVKELETRGVLTYTLRRGRKAYALRIKGADMWAIRDGSYGRLFLDDIDSDEFRALRGRERHVYLILVAFAGQDSFAWPTQATIARIAGMAPESVNRAIARLVAAGFVERTEHDGRRVYVLVKPPSRRIEQSAYCERSRISRVSC